MAIRDTTDPEFLKNFIIKIYNERGVSFATNNIPEYVKNMEGDFIERDADRTNPLKIVCILTMKGREYALENARTMEIG